MRLVAAFAILAAAVTSTVASPRGARQSSIAAARSSKSVSFEFRATTPAGDPIADLRASDIALKVGGRARELQSLELVTLSRDHDEASGTPGPSFLPAAFAVSSGAQRGSVRHVMLVVDEASVRSGEEHTTRDFVSRLLAQLSSRDRVGLLSFGATSAEVGFTSGDETIQRAVDAIAGGRPPASVCHLRDVSRMLQTAIALTPRGMASTVIVLSATELAVPMPIASGSSTQPRYSQSCTLQPTEIAAVERAVARAQINVYVEGHQDFATAIGADPVSREDRETPERVLRETGAFYRATFVADKERPEDLHRLALRVDRSAARVRAPSFIRIPLVSETITTHGAGSGPDRSLALRAAAVPAQHGAGKVKLLVIFEPVDSDIEIADATVAAIDEQGQTAAQATLRPSVLSRRPVIAALSVPSGTYRLRVVAGDSSGRRGTVDDVVRAQLTPAGSSISVSGLLLGTSDGGTFGPRLVFTRESHPTAYLELYGATPDRRPSVVFELADSLDGPARQTIAASLQPGPDGVLIATAEIPVDALPPGDVLVRAIVSANGSPSVRVVRTLRKAGAP